MRSELDNLLLHPRTKKQVQDFLGSPSHALLISAPSGSGKKTLALVISANLLNAKHTRLAEHPRFVGVARPADRQEIPIDAVRQLIKTLSLKAAAEDSGDAKRVVLIESAGDLSKEAQSALLKILEEPSEGTVFIMTVTSPMDVLPTIVSRTRLLELSPITDDMAVSRFTGRFDESAIRSAWALSQGGAGLLEALLSEGSEHPMRGAVQSAKEFLAAGTYERIIILDNLTTDRHVFSDFLDGLSRVLSALHREAIKKSNSRAAQRIMVARKLVNSAILDAGRNVSLRLIALNLATNIGL